VTGNILVESGGGLEELEVLVASARYIDVVVARELDVDDLGGREVVVILATNPIAVEQ
jgi:hypothetical protein